MKIMLIPRGRLRFSNVLERKPFSSSYLKFVKIYLKTAEMKLALRFKECAKELRAHFGI